MGHNVGDAAARSVEKSKKVEEKAARTPEQRIRDIRLNAEGLLSVPNHEVVFLLEQYDLMALKYNAAFQAQTEAEAHNSTQVINEAKEIVANQSAEKVDPYENFVEPAK